MAVEEVLGNGGALANFGRADKGLRCRKNSNFDSPITKSIYTCKQNAKIKLLLCYLLNHE